MEAGSWFCCPGPRGTSRKPGPCSMKWNDWYILSPGLSVGDVGGGVGRFLPLLYLRVRPDMASLEFSVGDVTERAVRVFFFALGMALRTSCYFRPSPGLSVMDVDRAAEVGVRRSQGLCAGVVRGREWGSSPLVISLLPSPELSVRDVGEAAEGDVVLLPSLAVGRVGGSVRGVASTRRFLAMSPELSVGGVGEAAVGKILAPELCVEGVESRALQDEAPLTQITSQLSVEETDDGAGQLFSPVL